SILEFVLKFFYLFLTQGLHVKKQDIRGNRKEDSQLTDERSEQKVGFWTDVQRFGKQTHTHLPGKHHLPSLGGGCWGTDAGASFQVCSKPNWSPALYFHLHPHE
uniref:Uncharacterized protein n=1 Tax=Oryzias latipes TaxID=8090 RepID=A0A3P9HM07_ORYLA